MSSVYLACFICVDYIFFCIVYISQCFLFNMCTVSRCPACTYTDLDLFDVSKKVKFDVSLALSISYWHFPWFMHHSPFTSTLCFIGWLCLCAYIMTKVIQIAWSRRNVVSWVFFHGCDDDVHEKWCLFHVRGEPLLACWGSSVLPSGVDGASHDLMWIP